MSGLNDAAVTSLWRSVRAVSSARRSSSSTSLQSTDTDRNALCSARIVSGHRTERATNTAVKHAAEIHVDVGIFVSLTSNVVEIKLDEFLKSSSQLGTAKLITKVHGMLL